MIEPGHTKVQNIPGLNMHKGRTVKPSRACCCRLVVLAVCTVLLSFIILTDLQEDYNFYVQKYLQPSSKSFICIQQTGDLEKDLFSFAFGFGLANRNSRYLAIIKGSVIQQYFKLPSTKVLKNSKVCDMFEKRNIAQNWVFNSSEMILNEWTHYNYVNGSGFVSVNYFDEYNARLLKELSFVDDSIRSAKVTKLAMHGNGYANFNDVVEVVIYVAKATFLEASFGQNYKSSLHKYLLFSMKYFTFRFEKVRFLVLLQCDEFATVMDIDTNANVSITYLKKDINFRSLSDKNKLAFLTSCNHVIITGAADMYGWWVGYLSPGDVVYPVLRSKDTCSGTLCGVSEEDIYPHRWIGLTFE